MVKRRYNQQVIPGTAKTAGLESISSVHSEENEEAEVDLESHLDSVLAAKGMDITPDARETILDNAETRQCIDDAVSKMKPVIANFQDKNVTITITVPVHEHDFSTNPPPRHVDLGRVSTELGAFIRSVSIAIQEKTKRPVTMSAAAIAVLTQAMESHKGAR